MKNSLLFIFFITGIFFSVAGNAQQAITLKAYGPKGTAIAFTTFTIVPADDTVHSTKYVADSNGIAHAQLFTQKQYIITATSINYQPQEKRLTIAGNESSISFSLIPLSKSLKEVVVQSSRPLMRQEEDKTIVEPENLAAASTNAFEILEKTPGLFTDQDGNVYITSATPAAIYINGREMKMSASDVATMLKNLPPSAIARIEILRTPSAKYDASGGGGVVNIVLKKGVKLGMNGSINTGISQGIYGNQFAGINITNNNDGKNSYLNAQYTRSNRYELTQTSRIFSADSLLEQHARTTYPNNNFNIGYGLGNVFSKKWEVSYDGRINFNSFNNITSNESVITKSSLNETVTDNITRVSNDGNFFSINQGINSKYKIDTIGSEWTNDLSWNFNRNKSDQLFSTSYLVPVFPATGGDGDIESSRHYAAFQSDIKFKLPKQYTVEGGIKSTITYFKNTSSYTDADGNKDAFRTTSFKYKENINAAYIQGTKTIKDVVIKTGIRFENTNMSGNQLIPLDTSFSIHRTDPFPYIYLSKKVMAIAGYDLRGYLVYRRTIARPAYDYLNPFPRFIDQYLFETGNPSLRPQFNDNYEANISYDDMPIIAIGHNYTKDIFSNVIYQADSNQSIAYRTWDNLGTNKEFYIRALGAIPPGGKYFAVISGQYNHNFYEGVYEGKPLSFKRGSWSFFTYHQLKLSDRSQLSMHAFVRFNGLQQFYELGTFGALWASINRQFFDKKLTATISVSDILFTNNNTFTINQGSINASGYRESDTRRFNLNLRYNFGMKKKEEKKSMFDVDGE